MSFLYRRREQTSCAFVYCVRVARFWLLTYLIIETGDFSKRRLKNSRTLTIVIVYLANRAQFHSEHPITCRAPGRCFHFRGIHIFWSLWHAGEKGKENLHQLDQVSKSWSGERKRRRKKTGKRETCEKNFYALKNFVLYLYIAYVYCIYAIYNAFHVSLSLSPPIYPVQFFC